MKSTSLVVLLACLQSITGAYGQTRQETIVFGSGSFISNCKDPQKDVSPVTNADQSRLSRQFFRATELKQKGITTAKSLIKFGFYIEELPNAGLPGFTIKMKHIDASGGDATILFSYADPASFTQVYYNPLYKPLKTGFDTLTLQTPFDWDGTGDIMMEVCYDSLPAKSESGEVRIYKTNTGSFGFIRRNDDVSACTTEVFPISTNNQFREWAPQSVMVFCCYPDYERDVEVIKISDPQVPFMPGNQEVKAIIKNKGTKTLDSVKINWIVNSVEQPTLHWKGTLLPGQTSLPISLGQYNFKRVKLHDFYVYLSEPNGKSDEVPSNNFISQYIYAGFSDTVKIGTDINGSPDFFSFNEALTALKLGGVVGPTVFSVLDGEYEEKIHIRDGITGASSVNTITFESASADTAKVKIIFNPSVFDNYVLGLTHASFFIFRNLSFITKAYFGTRVLVLKNGSHYNQFINNSFRGYASGSNADYGAVIYSDKTPDQNNVFRGNTILSGSYGMLLYGQDTAFSENGTVIENNRFVDQWISGITAENYASCIISSNFIYSKVAPTAGISLKHTSGIQITGNKIINKTGSKGISIENCKNSSLNKGLIANNFIVNGSAANSYGIHAASSAYWRVYHNSVNVPGNTSTESRSLHIGTGNTHFHIKNNILSNSGGGYTYYVAAPAAIDTSDYNDFYTTGANLAYWGTSPQATLAALQSASGGETHSLSVDPQFFLPDSDLHLLNPGLNETGIPLAEVPADIDGSARSAIPDIGADEFTIGLDGGVGAFINLSPGDTLQPGSIPIRILISNNGSVPVSGFQVSYSVNGIEKALETFTGTIQAGQTAGYLFTTLYQED